MKNNAFQLHDFAARHPEPSSWRKTDETFGFAFGTCFKAFAQGFCFASGAILAWLMLL